MLGLLPVFSPRGMSRPQIEDEFVSAHFQEIL